MKSNPYKVVHMQTYAKLPFEKYKKEIFDFSRTDEDALQQVFFQWLNHTHPDMLAFAIPNGSHKSIQGRILFQLTGLKKGVADVFIAYPTEKYHGLFIEFKNGKKGKLSPEQKAFGQEIENQGYKWSVCTTIEEAIEVVEEIGSRLKITI